MKHREFVYWAAREVGVVVVGILIAFSLNEWWQERGLRDQEQVHLRALASDFAENVRRLQQLTAREEKISAASKSLLDLAVRDPAPPSASVRPLLNEVFTSVRFEPVTGAYVALLNSGGLSLIPDNTLRASLAGFSSDAGNRYYEQLGDQLYLTLVREFAGRLGFADQLAALSPPPASLKALLGDAKFREHLALRHLVERDITGHYHGLLSASERIVGLVKQQLD